MSRLRANQITNENANGAPNFPHGLTVTGIITATNNQTTFNDIVVGSAVTANSQGIDLTGIVTATTVKVGSAISMTDSAISATRFHGSGANLTGVSGPEVYGFTGIGSHLQVRTTGGGADNITGAQYDAFEQVLFAPSGITFSINNNGNLIATF